MHFGMSPCRPDWKSVAGACIIRVQALDTCAAGSHSVGAGGYFVWRWEGIAASAAATGVGSRGPITLRFRCKSASEVLPRGAVKRNCAHVRESPQRYSGVRPKLRYGGPPPRVALVARVASVIGNPIAVSASAVSLRRSSASGLVGIIFAIHCAPLRACDGNRVSPIRFPIWRGDSGESSLL
jgi:hypothetical protein